MDFLETKALREALHAREGGFCFYCLRRVNARARCLDHVVPRVRMGGNGYRNLVSACLDCNSFKGEMPAEDFLRQLYRERRLTAAELAERLGGLDKLAGGELRPIFGEQTGVNGRERAQFRAVAPCASRDERTEA